MFKAISAVIGYSLAMPLMPSVPKIFPKEGLLYYQNRPDFTPAKPIFTNALEWAARAAENVVAWDFYNK
jgi:hypothetical protein